MHARIAENKNSIFIQGHCLAQMKKSVQYKSDIQISKSTGFIDGTHCECAVGSDDTAHCKHIAVLLWAMEEMEREKKMILRTVCTQELQTFHRSAKSFFGSPIKAEALPSKSRDLSLSLDPVVLDPSIINKQSYCEKQRNRAINYAASYKTTMPFLRLFAPADTYCAIWDHNYTNIDPEERLLDELKLLSVTAEDIETIERETRGQAASKIWFKQRHFRITASNFYKCCIIR
ncbi:GSCOCG00012702001-RA-CDS, partial [Cotesia congregata]